MSNFWENRPVRKKNQDFEVEAPLQNFNIDLNEEYKIVDGSLEELHAFILENNPITPSLEYLRWYFNLGYRVAFLMKKINVSEQINSLNQDILYEKVGSFESYEKIGSIAINYIKISTNKNGNTDTLIEPLINYLCIKKEYHKQHLNVRLIDYVSNILMNEGNTLSLFGSNTKISNLEYFDEFESHCLYIHSERNCDSNKLNKMDLKFLEKNKIKIMNASNIVHVSELLNKINKKFDNYIKYDLELFINKKYPWTFCLFNKTFVCIASIVEHRKKITKVDIQFIDGDLNFINSIFSFFIAAGHIINVRINELSSFDLKQAIKEFKFQRLKNRYYNYIYNSNKYFNQFNSIYLL